MTIVPAVFAQPWRCKEENEKGLASGVIYMILRKICSLLEKACR